MRCGGEGGWWGRGCFTAAVAAAPAQGSSTDRARLPALGLSRQRDGAGRAARAWGVLRRSRRAARRRRGADTRHLLPGRGRARFTRSLLPGPWQRLVPGDRSASGGGGVDSACPDALALQGSAGAPFSLTYFCLPSSLSPLLSTPWCVCACVGEGRRGQAGRQAGAEPSRAASGRRGGACGVLMCRLNAEASLRSWLPPYAVLGAGRRPLKGHCRQPPRLAAERRAPRSPAPPELPSAAAPLPAPAAARLPCHGHLGGGENPLLLARSWPSSVRKELYFYKVCPPPTALRYKPVCLA